MNYAKLFEVELVGINLVLALLPFMVILFTKRKAAE